MVSGQLGNLFSYFIAMNYDSPVGLGLELLHMFDQIRDLALIVEVFFVLMGLGQFYLVV